MPSVFEKEVFMVIRIIPGRTPADLHSPDHKMEVQIK